MPAAVAVELIHNFPLLHDDVIDGDTTRRHRPTAWTVFGQGAAVLTGSALETLAVDVLAASGHPAALQATRQALDELRLAGATGRAAAALDALARLVTSRDR